MPPDPLPPSTLRHPTPPPPPPGPMLGSSGTIIRQNSSESASGRGTPVAVQLPAGSIAQFVGPTVVINSSKPGPAQQASDQRQADTGVEAASKKCMQFLRALISSAKDKEDGGMTTEISQLVGGLLVSNFKNLFYDTHIISRFRQPVSRLRYSSTKFKRLCIRNLSRAFCRSFRYVICVVLSY